MAPPKSRHKKKAGRNSPSVNLVKSYLVKVEKRALLEVGLVVRLVEALNLQGRRQARRRTNQAVECCDLSQ